jgi:hypothetical protein
MNAMPYLILVSRGGFKPQRGDASHVPRKTALESSPAPFEVGNIFVGAPGRQNLRACFAR